MLLASFVQRQHHVRVPGRPQLRLIKEAAAGRQRLLPPEGPVPLRGRGERPVIRQEGHICTEVDKHF